MKSTHMFRTLGALACAALLAACGSDGSTDSLTGTAAFDVAPPSEEAEGCTPGFWKNRALMTGDWETAGWSPDQKVEAMFGDLPSTFDALEDDALLEALGYRGGSALIDAGRILLRAAVASVLNADHPDVGFPNESGYVIDQVGNALASGDRDTILGLAESLDEQNNAGCPIGDDDEEEEEEEEEEDSGDDGDGGGEIG